MRGVAAALNSLSGRIVLLLTIGMTASAFLALFIAEQAQRHFYDRIRLEMVVTSTADILRRLENDPEPVGRMLENDRILGASLPPPGRHVTAPDAALTALLRERLGTGIDPRGQQVEDGSCFPSGRFDSRMQAAGMEHAPLPVCWLIDFREAAGQRRTIGIYLPRFVPPPRATLESIYLLLLLGTSAALGILIARAATAPLRRLTWAARTFSVSEDPAPLSENGPVEVRTAIATFNLMQARVTQGLRERTNILAAISHDLQTPLTRLRLRLEQVADEALRERLIADLAGTHKLVREGLDLARSSENREDWQIVDIDSLLASLAEDAAEFGADVRYVAGCGRSVRTKPDAMIRCLTNLIDNAVKYGGSADIRCQPVSAGLEIRVSDHGPGLPPEALERMFEPFVRAETSRSRATGGTGIGLTIARAQARLFDGQISLSNNPAGGLSASVLVPLAAPV